ncbi:type VII secretion protein EccE [Mycobacterium sp. OTB74]|jgi:type VII secretion protein EccE|uniref:type VII secretion protein EccE n=1 Tax=Mycobacterium sp. OTB74 TaxID=1853452 RepID=UPI0024768295|nr:type VII secretion protein EccE [Mycobacterium sp. OTB74]MDH6243295.1 type VII secretion protein EccE [Mycobacterium sp. OTB74]
MTARITLALLAIVPAVMTYPWHTTTHKWVLGIAAGVLVIVFAWWRGLFVTTMLARRFAVWRRNLAGEATSAADAMTVVLKVQTDDRFPYQTLPLIAAYVDRYGIRCKSVRVTEHQVDDTHQAWVSVTIAAEPNIAALQARSSELPLADAAQQVARRLADQLREAGLQVFAADSAPTLLQPSAREKWRAVRDSDGYLTAYGLPVDQRLANCLAELASNTERWSVLEFSREAATSVISAACAVRTATAPAALSGLVCQPGRQRPLMQAMAPASPGGLGTPTTAVTAALLAALAPHNAEDSVAVS